MRAVFLSPLITAFGEAIYGARLASDLVDAGWSVDFLAPTEQAPIIRRDRRVRYARIDRAMHRLDQEVADIPADLLVLVDVAGVDKVTRLENWSADRLLAGKKVVGLDCWNHLAGTKMWDYGPWSEPVQPYYFEHTHVICPVPITRPTTTGGYRAIPQVAPISDEARREIRRHFGVEDHQKLVVWPMARWQNPEIHRNRVLIALAGLWPSLILPAIEQWGDDVKVIHVSPTPIDEAARPRNYVYSDRLLATAFDALIGSADALLCVNASATTLVTALAHRTPTLLCMAQNYADDPRFRALELPPILVGFNPPPIRVWPLSLDALMTPVLTNNPFYETMKRGDLFRTAELVETMQTILFDTSTRAQIRTAQDEYHRLVSTLPTGVERVMTAMDAT